MGECMIDASGTLAIRPIRGLAGMYRPPGDKSISHRALIIGALAEGETSITGLAPGGDVACTSTCLQKLGVDIRHQRDDGVTFVTGAGAKGLRPAVEPLFCGNSGTTARLLAGVIAGQGIPAVLTGDASLTRRPMSRIAEPLRAMGAEVELTDKGTLPMRINPGPLRGICWHNPVASAQVKSAVLFAGLGAEGPTELTEPVRSRDHTERMLIDFGAMIETSHTENSTNLYTVRIMPDCHLRAREISVPGDASSAIYLVVAALICPESDLTLSGVGMNPGRRGALDVLIRMGADMAIEDEHSMGNEPVATLRVRHSRLKGTEISGLTTTWLIDEIPALAVAAAFADGKTHIKDVLELRKKESDRISTIVSNLLNMGVEVNEHDEGFTLQGGSDYPGAAFDSFGDHRIALAFHVAALACRGESTIRNYGIAEVSWPDFPVVVCDLESS